MLFFSEENKGHLISMFFSLQNVGTCIR